MQKAEIWLQVINIGMMCRSDSAVAAQLPIHSFINDLDIVPRLLGSKSIMSLLQVIQPFLPKYMGKIMAKAANSPGSFVLVGTAYLLLLDSIQVFDNCSEAEALSQTVGQLFGNIAGQIQLVGHLLSDHKLEMYTNKLTAAVLNTVQVLFMGGQEEDYEPTLIKRISSASGSVSGQP